MTIYTTAIFDSIRLYKQRLSTKYCEKLLIILDFRSNFQHLAHFFQHLASFFKIWNIFSIFTTLSSIFSMLRAIYQTSSTFQIVAHFPSHSHPMTTFHTFRIIQITLYLKIILHTLCNTLIVLFFPIQCFLFYFGMSDIVIFWSIFDQKSCSWTFFISTFHSYFVKKITAHLCHYFSLYRISRKATNFGKIFKNITFFWRNYIKIATISWFQPKFLLKLLLTTNTVKC